MDEREFKARAGRLDQIAKVIEKLPPEIRSDAFDLIKDFVTDHSVESPAKRNGVKAHREVADDAGEEFFGAYNHDKPADNARLIAAWFYREFGVEPFSLDEVRKKADDVGLTIPTRIDMTFLQAKEKGKKLFARAGVGKFKPTVHGETNLKATYSVSKGTKKREGDAE